MIVRRSSALHAIPVLPLVLLLPILSHALAAERPDNVPPDGYVALFNGKDLSGWKGLFGNPAQRASLTTEQRAAEQAKADERMRAHWRVEDGALVFDGKGDSLCTAKDYEDFDFYVDWKILKDGDSGIYLRGTPQVQIWERPGLGSGGLYNNQKYPANPLVEADRPVGEWNTFRIIMIGERVTVYLNGVLVVDDTPLENYWERGKPIYPSGQIELQNHGNTLYFKNIYIREIPRAGRPEPPSPVLRKGARVAVVGDSITEQKLYSHFIEAYLVLCLADLGIETIQLGWSGERAPGFADRLANDLLPWRPDVVTTCYGMNDGSYRAYDPSIGAAYGRAMRDIVKRLKAAGAIVAVGSPGAVDFDAFRRADLPAAVYNDNLAHLRDIARDIALEEGMPFANVHDPMILAQKRAKPVLGAAYDVCGRDGFHPGMNGHLVMAYAFLKAMGVSGEIGRITIDMKGEATASEGHAVRASKPGEAEIESTRYPFCFFGDPKSSDGTRSILPYIPFNQDLNRLTLTVKNLAGDRIRVTWGEASKVFARADLEKGINLAAEFLDNPFCDAFRKVDEAIARKQSFETPMIKEVIARFRTIRALVGDDAEAEKALAALRDRLIAKQHALAADVRAAVVPVRHRIRVAPE